MKRELFSDLFNFKKKSKIKAGDGYPLEEGEYPFFTSSNVLSKSIDDCLFKKPSLIFGTGGKPSVHFHKGGFAVSTDCLTAQVKDSQKVWPQFVYYFFASNMHVLEDGFKGAGLKHISKSYIAKILIPLPSLEIQKRIAAILDQADRFKELNKILIKKYDELTQSLFLDMIGDPFFNPKGWEKRPLKEFGNIQTGNTPSRKNASFYNQDYVEWIKTDNIMETQTYVSKAKEFLSRKGLEKCRFVEKGAVLVACIAGSLSSIGRASLTDRKVAFNQQINTIQPNLSVDSYFLYYLIKNSQKYIQNHASKGMKKILTKGNFEKIEMIMPPIAVQQAFSERAQNIGLQITLISQASQKSEELFQSLLQQAFKGELLKEKNYETA